MSAEKPRRKSTIWDDIKFDKPVPGLAALERQKEPLLNILCGVHEDGPKKSEPFDAVQSWRALRQVAEHGFWGEKVKGERTPAVERAKHLDRLADALGQARDLLDEAMQTEVGHDLFGACFPKTNDDEPFDPVSLTDEIKTLGAGLATLEAAARRAAGDAHLGRARPKGTGVVPQYLEPLAWAYRRSTGVLPANEKFTEFVLAFLAAIGRNIQRGTVTDAIHARVRSLQNADGWLSPFQE
jgi:hypothetical protein